MGKLLKAHLKNPTGVQAEAFSFGFSRSLLKESKASLLVSLPPSTDNTRVIEQRSLLTLKDSLSSADEKAALFSVDHELRMGMQRDTGQDLALQHREFCPH